MSITLSVATSADLYIDDSTEQRLVLSTAEDWAEVYRLRAQADAIVIGAETLRRDNPRLSLKSQELTEQRVKAGRTPEPHKIIISNKGEISPTLRIFDSPLKNIIIFSTIPRPELEGKAEVVVLEEISTEEVVTHLEQRGLGEIFVEGGAQIHSLFLESGCADSLRIAVNPNIIVDDASAPRFLRPEWLKQCPVKHDNLGGMLIENYMLKEDHREEDIHFLSRAICLSRNCKPSDTSYCVGAVVVTASGEIFEGYTHQTSPTHHAEQEAIKCAEAAGANLIGATMYSSMEPCSQRSSEPESCSQILIRHRFRRAVFALYEPSCFVCCLGALNMRKAGIDVKHLGELAPEVRKVNSHLNF